MHAVFLDFETLGADTLDTSPLTELLPDITCYPYTAADETADRIAGAGIVFVNKVRLSSEVLVSASDLRYVGIAATGTDNVDLAAAEAAGIAVTNIRGYCKQSVVEHVVGMLIAYARSTHSMRAAVAAGRWQASESFCLLDDRVRELSALTLGIVGYGQLGQAVATAAEAFGMRVLVAERHNAASTRPGRTAFHEVLERADVVSLHCPLTEGTANLFNVETLGRMRSDALLINTARGGLVDSAALVDALANGRLGGAAIDVLSSEPPTAGDPLLDYDGENLVLTPHIAWASETARRNAIDALAANVTAWRSGRPTNLCTASAAIGNSTP